MRPHRAVSLPAFAATAAALLLVAGCGGSRSPVPAAGDAQTTVRLGGGAAERAGQLSIVTSERPLVDRLGVSADSAWRVLPAVYAELGIDYRTLDQARRVIANDALAARRQLGRVPLSRYVSCGVADGRDNADSFAVTLSVRTQVVADSAAGTAVVSTLGATARSLLFGTGDVPCSSTQRLEDEIARLLKTKTSG